MFWVSATHWHCKSPQTVCGVDIFFPALDKLRKAAGRRAEDGDRSEGEELGFVSAFHYFPLGLVILVVVVMSVPTREP